jgi:hypothetical protein
MREAAEAVAVEAEAAQALVPQLLPEVVVQAGAVPAPRC